MSTLKKGHTFLVKHLSKGTFTMRIDSLTGKWARGHIVAGTARHISADDAVEGDEITVRIAFAQFTELEP